MSTYISPCTIIIFLCKSNFFVLSLFFSSETKWNLFSHAICYIIYYFFCCIMFEIIYNMYVYIYLYIYIYIYISIYIIYIYIYIYIIYIYIHIYVYIYIYIYIYIYDYISNVLIFTLSLN